MISLDLIRKYNRPGPRYTSYPTAPHFRDDIDRDELLARVRADGAGDVSLYFHLPFCESLCWFCGCTTVITRSHRLERPYLDSLRRELDLKQNLFDHSRPVTQMHFGGGTPTFFTPSELEHLGTMIRSRFEFAPDAEIAVEIDPRGLTRDHVQVLRAIGFNRASVGIQDHNADVQKAINRIQPHEMTLETIRWLREEGFGSVGVDLIYGLPLQTLSSFKKTLDEVIGLSPDRFAIFNYAHVPWLKPGQKIMKEKDLPSPETKLELLKLSIDRLTSKGYAAIGMDHWARPNDELAVAARNGTLRRNFQGYSTRGGSDIHAYGMSAISQTDRAYWQNEKDLSKWESALVSGTLPIARGYLLTEDDLEHRATIMELMSRFRTRIDDRGPLREFEEDGLVEFSGDEVVVTETGRFFVRNIAMVFDAYLKDGAARYSRTV